MGRRAVSPAAHLFAGLLIAITVAVYAPLGSAPFVALDDVSYVKDNPIVRDGLTAASLLAALRDFHQANWHPATWIAHMVDVSLFGMEPGGHHLVNVAWHCVNTFLLFVLLARLTGRAAPSLGVAALFALHPLHVESVAWVAERKDLLSTFFGLLALLAHLRYARRPTGARAAAVALLLALGLMAKPMLVTVPFLLLLLDWWPLGRWAAPGTPPTRINAAAFGRLLREKLPLFGLVAASSLITLAAQQRGGALRTLTLFPLSQRLENAALSYLAYLGKTVWPAGLAVYYPYPSSMPPWQVAGAAALLLAASVMVLRLARRFPWAPVGWFWYLGTLVPVIGLVQVGNQAFADRYTYLPLVGIFLLVVWSAAAAPPGGQVRRVALPAAFLLALLPLAVLARRQVGLYESNERLLLRTLAVTGPNPVIETNLGVVYLAHGDTAAAERHYRQALAIDPLGAVGNYNLADLLIKTKRREAAVPYLRRALAANPGEADAHYYLGLYLAQRGDPAEAADHLRAALRRYPDHPVILSVLARLDAAAR